MTNERDPRALEPKELRAIRRRDSRIGANPDRPELDRRALLAHLDAIDDEVRKLGEQVAEVEGTIRFLAAFQIEKDGYAKNLGEAFRIMDDPARMAELYPSIS